MGAVSEAREQFFDGEKQREACGHRYLSHYKSELCYKDKLARLCHGICQMDDRF